MPDLPAAIAELQRRIRPGDALLSPSFEDDEVHETVAEVHVPEPEPVVAYIASFGPDHVGVTAPDQSQFVCR